MAIFRGVGGSGSSSDNSFLQEVTAQATIATNKASEASASATSAEASATSAANSLATIQNTEVTSASFNTGDGVLTLTKLGGATVTADLDGRFLTSYTETNDLSSAVTWVNVPNAYITEGSVTQHQSAINANVSITESQISDLQSYLTSETSHADVLVDGDFTSNGFMKRTGAGTYAIDSNTYLTSEVNDLTTTVTWANVPDANITQSSVTQHQAALSITESQISDLQTYLTAETNDLSTTVTWANVPDANITQSSVTQHQAALTITESQISDLQSYLTSYTETNDLSTAVTWANVPDANITQSSVTQHQAALSITESQISDLGTYLTASDITGKADLSGATFTGNVNIGLPPTGTQSLTVAGSSTLYGGVTGGLDVTGDITVTGTVDGVDIATLNSNALVDGDFTSNGFMKRTGAGTYTVDTNNYVTTGGGTFYGDVTVTGIPTSGEGTLTANFIKGSTISGGATTPVLDLEKNVTGTSGSGRFIEFNTKHHSTSSIVTRGYLGINQSSANGTAHPYFSHNDGNCGFAITYSGSSSYNSIIPASTTGGSTSSNINLGHQFSRWNGIYLKISPNVSSDREYKRDIEELSEAEKRVAVACKGLIRKYRMKDAYEEKGESARLHIGIVAQDLQDAFTAEGLDAHRYGMFCSDTWHQATVTTEDEDGNVTTSVEDFELVEHAPEGATNITEITRLSVRYEELLAFIISTT